jgi:hypothetical protein
MVVLLKKSGRSFLKAKAEKAISPVRAEKLPDVQQKKREKPRLKLRQNPPAKKPSTKPRLRLRGG